MKKLLLLLIFACPYYAVRAQNDEISQFQRQHPEISFISQDRFNTFSHEEIILLSDNYIVFEDKIKLSDILKSNPHPTNKSNIPDPIEGTDTSSDALEQIKNWIGIHQNVKIVKHSEYEIASQDLRNEYQNNHCLILIGEVITHLDIELYAY